LHAILGTPAAPWIGFAGAVAVVARIGIDQAADRAMFLRELGLESAPATAVAGDDDLAAHVDAAARELLVIVGHALVGVDEAGGDVTVATVGVVRRQRTGRVDVASPGTGGSNSFAL
jgi:hypothetical protein